MNPMIAFLKKQKPEWEEYLNLVEMMHANNDQTDSTVDPLLESTHENESHLKISQEIRELEKTKNKLIDLVNSLREELEEELEFSQTMAEAIGACPECFGDDELCHYCDGQGVPGYFVPDFIQYNRFISTANKKFTKHYRIRN